MKPKYYVAALVFAWISCAILWFAFNRVAPLWPCPALLSCVIAYIWWIDYNRRNP